MVIYQYPIANILSVSWTKMFVLHTMPSRVHKTSTRKLTGLWYKHYDSTKGCIENLENEDTWVHGSQNMGLTSQNMG